MTDLSHLPSPSVEATEVPDNHGANLYRADPGFGPLLDLYLEPALRAHLEPHLDALGALAGRELDALAAIADQNPPTLSVRARNGRDLDTIHKHPAYVAMERMAFGDFGLARMSHRGGVLGWPEPMPAAAKYALTYLFVQAEFGLCCPVSMTDSLTRTLRKFGSPELVEQFLPMLTAEDFDAQAQGAMFMTEQGAGSDVSATATRASRDADGTWRLHGDKWFCSNPDADFAMVLARPDDAPAGHAGVTLFLLPRRLPDGSRNAYRILRLKDKLGTRSMASGEIRLEGAVAHIIGEVGNGFRQMADMVNNSRLSNGVRAAGLMRRALTEALFIARERRAFGRTLIEMPLMQRQLAKQMVWAEQARSMVFQTAEALAAADGGDAAARPLARIMTPLIKYRACRDARKVTGDAMEVRGGCGYIEEWSDPRLLRDAHLGSIWEGTSNIVALDVIRAMRREGSADALEAHVAANLAGAKMADAVRARFDEARERAFAFARRAAEDREGGDLIARQAAAGLYHITTAAAMAREATRLGDPRRLLLGQFALAHRLLPRDPLADERAQARWLPMLLTEQPLGLPFEDVSIL